MTMVIKMPYTEKEKDEFYSSLSGAPAKAPCQCPQCEKRSVDSSGDKAAVNDIITILKIFSVVTGALWILSYILQVI
jgi:hypothetical protein